MNWKPIRKILSQIYLAIIGNGAVAGVIAGTDSDWKGLALTSVSSALIIIGGYLVPSKPGEPTA